MTNLLQLPRLHYIVFQLIRFEITEKETAQASITRQPPPYESKVGGRNPNSPKSRNYYNKKRPTPSTGKTPFEGGTPKIKGTGLPAFGTGGANMKSRIGGNAIAVETDVVVLNVFPTVKEYQYSGRKEYVQGVGEDNITVVKGGLAPRKISLEGTFGMRPIKMGTKISNGYQRLEEFRQVFIKSQSIDPVKPSIVPPGKKYVYGMNFYDFTEPYWGSIEPDTLIIRSDAKTHSQLPMYKIQFTGLGKLIDVPTKDPIIRNLGYAIKLSELFDGVNAQIDNFMRNNKYAQLTNEILVDMQMASDAIDAAGEMTSQYTSILNEVPLIGQSARMGSGYLLQGARLASVVGIPLLLAKSGINNFGDLL